MSFTNYNIKFMQFLYEPMKNDFCTKFIQTYET